ncbi:helix-turn-helix domain-containing protein [Agromyces bauzanensis]
MSETATASSAFGERLRAWRSRRQLSQLALASATGTTSRHLSFLETGRSRPSRSMVLRLAESLDVPLRERNALLQAAGLPAAFPATELESPALLPYRDAIERLMRAHEPYPALLVDSHWNVVSANDGAVRLFGADAVGSNVVRRFVLGPTARASIVNWPDVAGATLDRLRHESDRAPFDGELASLLAEAELAVAGLPGLSGTRAVSAAVCPWFRVGDTVVRTIAMVARFDPVSEVTLDELRVELFSPQDAAAERFFRDGANLPS